MVALTDQEQQCIQKAFLRHIDKLLRIAGIYYKPDEAEDMVQDAFEVACTKPEALLSSPL